MAETVKNKCMEFCEKVIANQFSDNQFKG